MDDINKQVHRGGRPLKAYEIPTDRIIEIMLKSAANGGFFCNLPADIWLETKIMVSLSYLEKLKDEQFIRSRSVASGMCFKYWTEMAAQAAIPSAMWKFIAVNVAKWGESKNVVIDVTPNSSNSETEQERIDRVKVMLAEVVS